MTRRGLSDPHSAPAPSRPCRRRATGLLLALCCLLLPSAQAGYANFEVSHVHPIALTPSGARLLVVNTPDAVLEVFAVQPDGTLVAERSIPVGLEPVSVTVRAENEAWVVNHLSDGITVVDPALDTALASVRVGDEPTDVAFAGGRAFVSVAGENAIKVFDPANLAAPPAVVPLPTLKPRALDVSPDGSRVWAVALHSGNRTTVVNANVIFGNDAELDGPRLAELGLSGIRCNGPPPVYPPLPAGIERNPALTDPPPNQPPPVSLIVRWNEAGGRWEDEAGQDWTHCLTYRLPDRDLFAIDVKTLAVQSVAGLGTSLFEVAVNPADGRVWVPHTEARNFVRFEHPLGVQGHVVDNRMAIVDPAQGFAKAWIDLNAHIDRASDPAKNLAEREASLSQPGMMVWNAAGTQAWLTAIGTRKLFRLDGACATGECIFGPKRASPSAVEVGQGPTGVALHEGLQRAYVLLRFTNRIAIVDTAALAVVGDVALHDPSPAVVLEGRRFLYDAIDGSGHGDAACASCHLSGDRDGLAWDLGDPTGEMVPYSTPMDNVRFIIPLGAEPTDCPAELCASHDGFDPQKGPMTTQTLRGMLEPLHWRGDRATMNDFNMAFPGLMGTADIGPVNGKPAGLPAADMERFRQFALGIRFPPNPLRNLDDSLPNAQVPVPGTPFSGNPANGSVLFDTHPSDAGQPCATCHTHPFGAGGGRLGGVEPAEPALPWSAALFNGDADKSMHSDLKIPHLRNMYEKIGPRFGTLAEPVDAVSGFGLVHDGSVPDIGTFLAFDVFALTVAQTRDVAAFMAHFPTGTRPAVGHEITLPPGAAAKGGDGNLALLESLGDRADPERHCELTASTRIDGVARRFRYENGSWQPDAAGEPSLSTAALRSTAAAPVHFLCAPIDSGLRLGGDRDEDSVLDRDDCAPADAGSYAPTTEIDDLTVEPGISTRLVWSGQAASTGAGVRYDVIGGDLSTLVAPDPFAGSEVLAVDLSEPELTDPRRNPLPGDGRYYLARAHNACSHE